MGFLGKYRWIIAILLISFLARLAFFFKSPEIWWDSAVYIGMGKFIFSLGHIGLWEYFRPPLWPMMLGALWKMGLDPIFFGRILVLLFSLSSVLLIYTIGRRFYDERIALLSSLFYSFVPIFFEFSHIHYNEIPSTFFCLLSIYYFTSESRAKYFLAGLFVGISFLIRFPQGIILAVFFLWLLINFKKKDFRKFLKNSAALFGGFAVVLVPFLIFNYYRYDGDFMSPFVGASAVINQILETAPAANKSWLFYFNFLPGESALLIFVLAGLYFSIREMLRKKFEEKHIITLAFLLSFAYYQSLAFHDIRYTISFLPFMFLISFYGLFSITERFHGMPKKIAYGIVMLVIIASFMSSVMIIKDYVSWQPRQMTERELLYFGLKNDFNGKTILSSTPLPAAFGDVKLIPLYTNYRDIYRVIQETLSSTDIDYIIFSDGDIPCPPQDLDCLVVRNEIINGLKEKTAIVAEKNVSGINYYIFRVDHNSQRVLDYPGGRPIAIIRMDDVGEPRNFEAMEKLLPWFVQHGMKINLNVIPIFFRNLTEERRNLVIGYFRENPGLFYIIQHGYKHETQKAIESTEFVGLPYDLQLSEIMEGKNILGGYFGQRIEVFSPPYDTSDKNTSLVLEKLNFTMYSSAAYDPNLYTKKFRRFNEDISDIADWGKQQPSIKDYDALISEYSALKKDMVIFAFHFHRLYERRDFEILYNFIEFMQKDRQIMTFKEADDWDSFLSNVKESFENRRLSINYIKGGSFYALTIGFNNSGSYTLEGNYFEDSDRFYAKNFGQKGRFCFIWKTTKCLTIDAGQTALIEA